MSQTTPDPLIGTVIDERYRLDQQLGSGGMGVVYRAQHLFLGSEVVVKLLRPELALQPEVRERFLREPRIAASLRHPNIIQVLDAGEDAGRPYLAMAYIDGSDLRGLLDREGPLAPDRALALLAQVAGALDAAHANGLVHRDVKPANILVTSTGRVFLSDFGVAKDTRLGGAMTAEGMFVGTLEYAAPEQFQSRPADARTDVYALGCVLFECLTGRRPFEATSPYELMEAHLEQPPPKVSEHAPGLPAALDGVVAKAMAKRQDDRHGSCSELIAAAQEVVDAAGPAAEPVSESGIATVVDPQPAPEAPERPREAPAPAPPPPVAEPVLPASPQPPRPGPMPPPQWPPAQGQPQPGAPRPAAAPGRRNTLAIAALVAGLLGLILPFADLAAIIMGAIALSQIRKDPSLSGKGLAIAGIALGGVSILIGLLVVSGGS